MFVAKIRTLKDPVKALSKAKDRTIQKKAIRQASTIIEKALQAIVPVKTGATKTAIGKKLWQKNSKVSAIIGPKTDYFRPKSGPKKSYLSDWKESKRKTLRKYKGQLIYPALYFQVIEKRQKVLERTMDRVRVQVGEKYREVIKQELDRLWKQ